MQKYTCSWSWHVSDVAFRFSPLRLVFSFWLSGHLFLAMQFISEFIWVKVMWNGLTWQAKTITVVLHQFHWKETSQEQEHVIRIQRVRTNQPLNNGRLATNQHLKSADLWCQRKNKKTKKPGRFKTLPSAFGLGRVISKMWQGYNTV